MLNVFIDDKELARLSFDLLTSSSVERYVRKARQAAWRSNLQRRLHDDPEILPQVIHETEELIGSLARSNQRKVDEARAALALAVVAESPSAEVTSLLRDTGLREYPSLRWIAALSRRLLNERATNMLLDATSGSVPEKLGPQGLTIVDARVQIARHITSTSSSAA